MSVLWRCCWRLAARRWPESVIGGADGPTSILLNWTPSADENRSVLVARLEEDDSYSYALIGAGDGEEALALFGGYSYAEQFAAFEDFAAMMQPAIVLEGNDAPLSIAVDADGLATVSAGEQMLAQFTDTPVFMIVTGSFAEGEMTMDENCDVQVLDENGVRVWSETAAVSGAYANICPNCGEINDGSSAAYDAHQRVLRRGTYAVHGRSHSPLRFLRRGLSLLEVQQPYHVHRLRRAVVLQGSRRPHRAGVRPSRLRDLRP